MSGIPKTFKAFTVDQPGKGSVKEVEIPSLKDGEVLVKIEYAAQNPTDWKHFHMFSPKGAILGGDVAGTIVQVGPNPKQDFNVGDKVAGIVHGNLYPDQGTFATYTKAQSEVIFKVPDGFDLGEASTFGVAWVTALQALILSQKHQWPPAKVDGQPWYLVYGGSTSVGLFAIQLAKLIGYKVISTASPRNHDLVKSYGADQVVDYSDSDNAISEIKRITGGGVSIGLDTISEGGSWKISQESFKQGGGRLNAILWATKEENAIRPDVEIVTTLMYTLFGKPFTSFGKDWPAVPEDHAFGAEIGKRSTELIEKYKIRGNPTDVRGGLDAVAEGLEHQKAGKVSGKKVVYKIGA